MTARLHFGCGAVQPPDWINVDRLDLGQEIVADVLDGLPFADGEFGAIVANHSLQQIGEEDLDRALGELLRVLMPGGIFRVLVPDVVAAFHARLLSKRDWPGFIGPVGWSLDRQFCHYLTQGGTNRVTFTASTLRDRMLSAGFRTVSEPRLIHPTMRALDSRLGESLTLDVYRGAV